MWSERACSPYRPPTALPLTVKKIRYSPGFRVCAGCNEIHLNAAFSEVIKEGHRKGRILCAMCTAVECTQHGFIRPKITEPTPADSASKAQTPAHTQGVLEL